MKQYLVGINSRSKELILGLMNLGATLMFTFHPITIELNKKFSFYDGEWMLYTDVFPDSGIEQIKSFLENEQKKNPILKYEIEYFQSIRKDDLA